IGSLLEAAGVYVTTQPAEAPVVIINSCGFIDPAKEESIDTILDVAELKDTGKLRRLIVTGCLTERYGTDLQDLLPEVDVTLGIDPHGAARAALWALGMRSVLPAECNMRALRFTPRSWAYLRISDGCDNCCAYCSIPAIRGPLVSRPLDEIVAEAQDLVNNGAKELNIIAQDTTAYGREHGQPRLHELLREISQIDRDTWIRLLYTHPAHYYPQLINVLEEEPSIVPYLDIPLQHISDPILKAMGRGINRNEIESLIETLRNRIPHLVLRTTFLVGFPGETRPFFRELMRFVRETRFERMGAFKYSPEENTAAAGMTKQVDEEEREERYHELMSLQQKIAYETSQKRIGKITTVMVETEHENAPDNMTVARSMAEAPDVDPFIFLEGQETFRDGQRLEVEITDAHGYDCFARPLTEESPDGQ
ncbi:MAG: 30S ribosomal protein S12 methylthiotransferase RimO, partial [Planctomycetota bacterium]